MAQDGTITSNTASDPLGSIYMSESGEQHAVIRISFNELPFASHDRIRCEALGFKIWNLVVRC